VITHAVVGLVGAGLLAPQGAPARLWILSPLVAALPDADALAYSVGLAEETWSHRGGSHSLAFAGLLGALVVATAFRRGVPTLGWGKLLTWAYFSGLAASHGLLDTLTNGGDGIELLWPLSDERYFAPFRPIRVAPLRLSDFLTKWGVDVLWSEIRWVWLPLLVLLGIVRAWPRRRPGPES
jgi:inner membrane protein